MVANGKPISPGVSAAAPFDFLLAAVATPILGMDFLAKFELSIIPAKQQVLHAASGRTFTKASTISFFY